MLVVVREGAGLRKAVGMTGEVASCGGIQGKVLPVGAERGGRESLSWQASGLFC